MQYFELFLKKKTLALYFFLLNYKSFKGIHPKLYLCKKKTVEICQSVGADIISSFKIA